MIVEINNQTEYVVPKEKIVLLLRLTSNILARRITRRLSVALVSPVRIKEMNRRYRGKNRVTDVLSFALTPSEAEIIICPNVAKKQAEKTRIGFQREILLLVLHGFLHINGFVHEKSKAAALKMAKAEDVILKKFYD